MSWPFCLSVVVLIGAGAIARPLEAQSQVDPVALTSEAMDKTLPLGVRIRALSTLYRFDPERGHSAAGSLLTSPEPDLRLAASWISAKEGDSAGEKAMIEMLGDEKLTLGFRGVAAKRLGQLKSVKAHPLVVSLASGELEAVTSGKASPSREGFRWSLLNSLGSYSEAGDLDVALRLYRATGLKAPARPVGLFGRPESLPLLREALARETNAGAVISIELAIARSGGEDGVAFVRQMLLRAASLTRLEGPIDLRKEDPASGRLAEDVLGDLGAHASDKQFFGDVLRIPKSGLCPFCGAAWGAMARIGTRAHETELMLLAERLGRGRADDVLRVLAYNGSVEQARELGKRAGIEKTAQSYVAAHESGADRKWFPLASAESD